MESAGSSNSDIPSMDDNSKNAGRRVLKRKGREDDLSTMFEKFTSDISSKLNILNSDLCSKISEIQDDINTVIKRDLERIQSDINVINSNQSQLFTDMNDVKKSLDYYDEEQKDLRDNIKSIETNTVNNTAECSALKSEVAKLQSELNTMQQRDRQQNLEISGIPEKSNEDLVTYVVSISQYVGILITSADVVHATRIQPRIRNPGRPKLVVVKLVSKQLRDSILSGVRAKKGVNTENIGLLGEVKKIFLNEHLTPLNKMLYKNVRDSTKAKNYTYTWIRDGKIFVRKDDTSPKILIKDSADLQKII